MTEEEDKGKIERLQRLRDAAARKQKLKLARSYQTLINKMLGKPPPGNPWGNTGRRQL